MIASTIRKEDPNADWRLHCGMLGPNNEILLWDPQKEVWGPVKHPVKTEETVENRQ